MPAGARMRAVLDPLRAARPRRHIRLVARTIDVPLAHPPMGYVARVRIDGVPPLVDLWGVRVERPCGVQKAGRSSSSTRSPRRPRGRCPRPSSALRRSSVPCSGRRPRREAARPSGYRAPSRWPYTVFRNFPSWVTTAWTARSASACSCRIRVMAAWWWGERIAFVQRMPRMRTSSPYVVRPWTWRCV